MESLHVFLSHNRDDKDTARRLGGQMRLAGADVWFDEWEIRAGDSIPGKVNDALAVVDTVLLLWSASANGSEWVRAKFEAAVTRGIEDATLRVIPVLLDDCPLPALLQRLRVGFATDQDRLRAIQAALDEASIEVRYLEGYGPLVCCPKCGADVDKLEGWSEVDERRDDMYAGFRCRECGFNDGGEI